MQELDQWASDVVDSTSSSEPCEMQELDQWASDGGATPDLDVDDEPPAPPEPPPRRPIQIDVEPIKCPACGSIEREPYHGTTTQEIDGALADGTHYSAIVRRRTQCASCGQMRVERHYEA